MTSKLVLVEHLSNISAVIKQPLQLTQRIKFTTFDVSKTYIVFGATSGGLYIFNRYPHQFIKLIPSKEGSIVQVCISPDERHVSFASSKGAVMVIQNCFVETNIQYQIYYEHRGRLVTAITWNADELYCGDNTGKITVITLPSLLAKAMFQATCAILMQLDTSVVQIDAYSKFLLISTLTRTYICDTDKEQYRQIGKKLRNGRFGACFMTNNIDSNKIMTDTLTNRGIFKKLKDDEQFLAQINDNVQIFCTRPGARMWEAKLDASVIRTHQFKNSFKHKPMDVIKLDNTRNINLNLGNNRSDSDEAINFSKVFILDNKFVITFNCGAFYLFDPITGTIVCWCNYLKNIKDFKVVDNFVYVWDDNFELRVVALYTLEKLIFKTLFNKQYYICAELCAHYITDIVGLVQTSNNIHLVGILKEKLSDQPELLNKLSPLFEAIQSFSHKKFNGKKATTGIVTVNPLFIENKVEKDQPFPESFQILKDIGANVTEKLTESTKNLKEKFQILETTVKNLTLNDTNSSNNTISSDDTSNNYDVANGNELSNSKVVESPVDQVQDSSKIFSQQYQLSKIHVNLEMPKFHQLLHKHDLNSVVELFLKFLHGNQNEEDEFAVKLWCYHYYLKYLSNIDFGTAVQSLKTDESAMQFALEAFCQFNLLKSTCACSYPLPSAKEQIPKYYDIGCILIKKFWSANRQLFDEFTNKVPYMWKYILKDLKSNDHIGSVLPLLMQFGHEDLIGTFANRFTYDEWDDAIQLMIKLKKYECVNCDNKFDRSCNVMSWTNFATIMVQSVGAQSTINLLMRFSSIIPPNELGSDFYQRCIFTTVMNASFNGTSNKALNFTKAMQSNDNTSLEFDNVVKKCLQGSYVKRPLDNIKRNRHLHAAKTDLNCSFCDLPLDIPLLKNYIKLSCNHLYHTICFKYNQHVCEKCKECM